MQQFGRVNSIEQELGVFFLSFLFFSFFFFESPFPVLWIAFTLFFFPFLFPGL
jgi:hypothetical protein